MRAYSQLDAESPTCRTSRAKAPGDHQPVQRRAEQRPIEFDRRAQPAGEHVARIRAPRSAPRLSSKAAAGARRLDYHGPTPALWRSEALLGYGESDRRSDSARKTPKKELSRDSPVAGAGRIVSTREAIARPWVTRTTEEFFRFGEAQKEERRGLRNNASASTCFRYCYGSRETLPVDLIRPKTRLRNAPDLG